MCSKKTIPDKSGGKLLIHRLVKIIKSKKNNFMFGVFVIIR